MLRFTGPARPFCDGVNRRNFLQVGAFGASLTLADLLQARAEGKGGSKSAKAAILIYLPGGPSHLDMYDLKPEAPSEIRGEFKSIPTNVSGVQICEHFPLQAKMWDKLAVIRSVVAVDEHSDSYVMTGYPDRVNQTAGHPSFGAVVSKARASGVVPPFVSLRGTSRGTEPGFLGIAHRPFTLSGHGNLLDPYEDVRRDLDTSGQMAGLDSYSVNALEMVTGGKVRIALDLTKEDAKTRERYKGVESFLTARRLVEAGVGCVTLSIGSWDTHGGNFTTLKRQLPQVDRGVANLIQDLHSRGLSDDVVTVMWGEFGRTPRVNRQGGRDHWSPVMSALIAGGGLKMGQVVGSSTANGDRPMDRPITVPQVLATVYKAIGIDPAQTFPAGNGRTVYVLDDREPVKELLG